MRKIYGIVVLRNNYEVKFKFKTFCPDNTKSLDKELEINTNGDYIDFYGDFKKKDLIKVNKNDIIFIKVSNSYKLHKEN